MITKEEVLKTAKLSKLLLTEEKVELFSHQLGDIIGYVDQLNELDTKGVEPSSRAVFSHNIFREDIVQKGLGIEDALSNTPKKENNMIKVPKI